MSKDGDVDDVSTIGDALVWGKDLEKHSCGEFSYAVVQANEVIEDHSQVETGSDAVFVGVYDGHGGAEASRFINDHLFLNLMSEFPPSPFPPFSIPKFFFYREMLIW